MKTAKVFQHGKSQAVCLPKEVRFNDDEVFIKKIGDIVVLIPKSSAWDSLVESLGKSSDDFMAERDQPKAQQRKMRVESPVLSELSGILQSKAAAKRVRSHYKRHLKEKYH